MEIGLLPTIILQTVSTIWFSFDLNPMQLFHLSLSDLIIISYDDFELKHHDVDLAEASMGDEDLIMEFYDLKEGKLNVQK